MKICSACLEELPKECFSKKQWQLKQYQRRCTECIDDNRLPKLTPPAKTESMEIHRPSIPSTCDTDGPTCWICLDGHEDSEEPLRRHCSCRGEAGFAHLSCLVRYAKAKYRFKVGHNPWNRCPNCKQVYHDELALDLASEYVAFAKEKVPVEGSFPLVDALLAQLSALSIVPDHNGQQEKVTQTASQIIPIIRRLKARIPSEYVQSNPLWKALKCNVQEFESRLHCSLGAIALRRANIGKMEERKENARIAIGHFEKCLATEQNMGGSVTFVRTCIAQAHRICEDGSKKSVSEELKIYQAAYSQHQNKHTAMAMLDGLGYSNALHQAKRAIEAERLTKQLALTCRRVLGPAHPTTKQLDKFLLELNGRFVTLLYQGEWRRFQILRYEEDGKKCVVQGPILNPTTLCSRNYGQEEKFIGDARYAMINPGTPVICHGLGGNLKHLNGKIGDTGFCDNGGYYEINFDDKRLEPSTLHHDNIRVLFAIPAV